MTSLLEPPASTRRPGDGAAAAPRPAGAPRDPERELLVAALRRRTPWWKPVVALAFVVGATGAIVASGAIPRMARRTEVAAAAERRHAASRSVQLATIRMAPATHVLALPGSTRPEMQADLFAQATGYLRSRHVDIGDRVKQGDVLAEIDIPLVDEQLRQAEAVLSQAEAAQVEAERTLELAKATLDRWLSVDVRGAVSQQELDEKRSAFEVRRASADAAKATVDARRADVHRLESQRTFGTITAPFDGTITARHSEIGDLVMPPSGSGGSNGGSGSSSSRDPLFTLARLDVLRVTVDVPQGEAYGVKVGQKADIVVHEVKDGDFEGVVTRTAGVLDERSRTLRVEITVPNPDGALMAGTYVQVKFEIAPASPAVIIPGASLIVRADGTKVAIVDANNAIAYVPVRVGRDLGTEVEIVDGLTGTERVVVNMGDEMPAGTVVEAVGSVKATKK
ncbi:MAG: efflux RND transporter periplasmic adaptor subunit [Phycisphaerales bacterium]